MSAPEGPGLLLHEDAPLFREAVAYTAAETGFAPRLIEKDYFCTVVLRHLAREGSPLVFRGGTCLAKVHLGFYRLSGDLDYVIPTAASATRGERSRRAEPVKRDVAAIAGALSGLQVLQALTGSNSSAQYNAVLVYRSLLGAQDETIRIEIGLREPLLLPPASAPAQTLLLDPILGTAAAQPVTTSCLSRREAMAEKLRAALSRREPAIRDFYDVDQAVERLGWSTLEPGFVGLVREKLRMPGNAAVDVSPARLAALRSQLDSELKPVLRDADFERFDLERAFRAVAAVAAALPSAQPQDR